MAEDRQIPDSRERPSDWRGPALAPILRAMGSVPKSAAKVVIIGHSQGAVDARVVAHDLPDRVAAIVGIAGPHGGSPVADALVGIARIDGISVFIALPGDRGGGGGEADLLQLHPWDHRDDGAHPGLMRHPVLAGSSRL